MVRVIIERRCRPDKVAEMESLLMKIRTEAIRQRGYISGETLRSVDDPSLWLIIATWVDADLWKAWETTPERRQIASKIEPLLVVPEKMSVYTFMT